MPQIKTLPLDFELTVYNGASFKREFRWLPDATTMDFTGWTGSFYIGEIGAAEEILGLTDTDGGVQLNAGGQILLLLTPVQTASLPTGVLTYSVDLTDPSGSIQRFLRGRLNVVYDVGRSS